MLNLRAMVELVDAADIVFHLAAAVGVEPALEDPISALTANISGSHNVLGLATARMIPIVLFSSSELYGRSRGRPLRETDDLVLGSPSVRRWSYAASKVADEFLALDYHRKRGLPVIVVHLFNTVRPRQVHHHGACRTRRHGHRVQDLAQAVGADGSPASGISTLLVEDQGGSDLQRIDESEPGREGMIRERFEEPPHVPLDPQIVYMRPDRQREIGLVH